MTIQALSIGLFIIGILLSSKWKSLLIYIFSVLFFGVYVFSVWQYKQGFFTCVFSSEEVIDKRDKIIKLVTLVMTITAITTIIGLMKYPLAARELGRSVGYTRTVGNFEQIKWEYRLNNIAGWSQIYGMVYLIPICILLFRSRRKMGYLIPAVICGICIIFSQITFAFILAIVLVFLFSIDFRNSRNSIITLTIVAALIILAYINKDLILRTLIDWTSNGNLEFLSRKLNELYLVTQNNITGDAELRFSLYQNSLNVFFEYPVFGYFATGQNTQDVFCYHSDFFDFLGFYGATGIIILAAIVIAYLRYILRFKNKYVYVTYLITVLILFVLNPIWYSPQIFIGSVMEPFLLYSISQGDYYDIESQKVVLGGYNHG